MFEKLMSNFRRPEGRIGGFICSMMNLGHAPMTKAVLPHLQIKEGEKVLDIGCGGGLAMSLMAEMGATVQGLDYSPVSVAKSLKKNQRAVEDGRIQVCQGDVSAMEFPEQSFDLATAFETVYFWDDVSKCFSRIFKALKPGGRLAIAVEAWLENGGKVNCPKAFESIGLNLYWDEDLRKLLQKAGFSRVEILKEGQKWLCALAFKTP